MILRVLEVFNIFFKRQEYYKKMWLCIKEQYLSCKHYGSTWNISKKEDVHYDENVSVSSMECERKTKYDFHHKGKEHSLLLMSFYFNHQKDCQETWQGNLFLIWFWNWETHLRTKIL